jgi:hypothetical protein
VTRQPDGPPATGHGPTPLAEPEVVGISCTAALVSDRPKKGEHRCFIAVQGADFTASLSLVLEKGARDRPAEEELIGQLVLTALARAADLNGIPSLELRSTEVIATEQTAAHWLTLELLSGRRRVIWSLPNGDIVSSEGHPGGPLENVPLPLGGGQGEGRLQQALEKRPHPSPPPAGEGASLVVLQRAAGAPNPRGVLCGAFNPLHYGHEQLRAAAENLLQGPVHYEMSLRNVDKPPLDFLTIDRRRAQFVEQPLALTVAPTFAEKADALPGVTFIVGVDTAERIVHPRYYGGTDTAMHAALAHIRSRGCRFLVAGRQVDGRFLRLADLSIPAEFADLFAEIPPDIFRADVSSTELRHAT